MAKKRRTLSDEVRKAVESCGVSRYAISKATGIDQAVLCRFVAGTHGMELTTLDTLAEYLDLHITTGKRSPRPRTKGK